jgi:hypothetical protein
MDYTFKNTLIKKFFEGDDSYIPTSELIYLHTHPLVRPNFLTELSEMLTQAGKLIQKHKLTHYSDRLMHIALRMGQELPTITEEQAKIILSATRDAYQLSNELITKLK